MLSFISNQTLLQFNFINVIFKVIFIQSVDETWKLIKNELLKTFENIKQIILNSRKPDSSFHEIIAFGSVKFA